MKCRLMEAVEIFIQIALYLNQYLTKHFQASFGVTEFDFRALMAGLLPEQSKRVPFFQVPLLFAF